MKITVKLFGGLRRRVAANPLEIDIREEATVAEVIEELGFRSGQVWLATLDGQHVEKSHPLKPDDELSLIPPVGGGN